MNRFNDMPAHGGNFYQNSILTWFIIEMAIIKSLQVLNDSRVYEAICQPYFSFNCEVIRVTS